MELGYVSHISQEEDVLDMLAQCEADEREGKTVATNRPPRGPKVKYLIFH